MSQHARNAIGWWVRLASMMMLFGLCLALFGSRMAAAQGPPIKRSAFDRVESSGPDVPTLGPLDVTGALAAAFAAADLRTRNRFDVIVAESRVGVNYGHDGAGAMYEVGHTFWITVTNSSGTPKAHATATTTPNGTGNDFAWSDGLWVARTDWSDPFLDIQPGDRVHFRADDGFADSIQVGTITAQLNPAANTVAGTVTAPGFVAPLRGSAGIWGVFWRVFTVAPDGGSYFVDFSPVDLLPGMEIRVGYEEPDKDAVTNVFRVPWQLRLPVVLRGYTP